MKVSTALRRTWAVYREHFGELMLTLLLQLVLRGIALTPLLFLAAPQTRMLALLCVPLYGLIVLPARQNVALALQDMLDGGSLFTLRLISWEDYGRKLLRGLAATLKMLLWCLPLIAGVILEQWAQKGGGSGSLDVATLMRAVRSLGGGDLMRGLLLLADLYLLTLIPPLVGCAFHCGTRHAAALGNPKLVRGHRGRLLRLWCAGLLAFLPFLAVIAYPCFSFLQALAAAVLEFFNTLTFTFPNPSAMLIVLGVSVVALLLPAIPFRTLLPAVYMKDAAHDAP